MRTWLDDDSDGWRLHRAVAARALEWQADDRSEQLLERGPRLAALQSWQVGHPNELTELEQQFLNASLRQERRRTTTKRLTVSALALLGGIALIAGLTVRSSRAAASESRRWSAFNTDEVTVRTLAARAREQATVNLDLALLLAVEANSIDATRQAAPDGTPPSTGAEARSSLLEVLQRTAYLTAFLYGDERPRRAAVLAASGTRVAAGSDNGTVAFWDVDERVLVRDPVAAHGTSEVRGLAASPDGTMVASSGEDGTVRIWDPVTGNPVGEALTHNEPDPDARTFNHNAVPAVTFSPDGRLLASGDRHGSIIVWDLASRQPVQRLQERTGGRPNDPDDPPIVLTLDFSPDTALLASAVTLPDADNNSNEEGTFTLWDWRTGTELLQHEPVHNGSTNAIQFDPSGEHFITCGQDRSIILWDLDKLLAGAGEASTSRRFSPHNNGVLDCVFTPDGTTIVSTSNEVALTDVHDRAAVLEGAALQTTYERAHTGVVAAVSFDPGSTRFITSATDGKIAVSDLAHTIAAGRRLHVPGESPSLAAGGPASGVGISPDGRTAVVGRPDGTLTIFDGDTGDVRAGPIDAHNNQIWLISFAPDGRSFFTGSSDSTVGKWDAETGQQLAMFRGHADSVAINSVSLSPDGAAAASCDTAGTMHVWDADLATERWNASVAGSDCSVGWLTNNVIVAAGGIQVTSWDAATGERLSRHVGAHSEPIQALAVGPDRRTFVTGGRDVDAVLWDAATVTTAAHASDPLSPDTTRHDHRRRNRSSFGAVAIAAVNNGTIALNSLDNGQLLSLLIGHQNGARRVASDAAGAEW
ncbi:MAG: WD40 repeat domain-containing protein [Acidimicrobiales bacterium]